MDQQRRKFSPQFKAEAAQFVVKSGRPVAHVARELQMNEGTLGNWVHAWREANPDPEEALSPVERQRISEMEAALRHTRVHSIYPHPQ